MTTYSEFITLLTASPFNPDDITAHIRCSTVNSSFYNKDKSGSTTFLITAILDCPSPRLMEVIKLLMLRRVDVNKTDSAGHSPLYHAVKSVLNKGDSNYISVMLSLIKNGAKTKSVLDLNNIHSADVTFTDCEYVIELVEQASELAKCKPSAKERSAIEKRLSKSCWRLGDTKNAQYYRYQYLLDISYANAYNKLIETSDFSSFIDYLDHRIALGNKKESKEVTPMTLDSLRAWRWRHRLMVYDTCRLPSIPSSDCEFSYYTQLTEFAKRGSAIALEELKREASNGASIIERAYATDCLLSLPLDIAKLDMMTSYTCKNRMKKRGNLMTWIRETKSQPSVEQCESFIAAHLDDENLNIVYFKLILAIATVVNSQIEEEKLIKLVEKAILHMKKIAVDDGGHFTVTQLVSLWAAMLKLFEKSPHDVLKSKLLGFLNPVNCMGFINNLIYLLGFPSNSLAIQGLLRKKLAQSYVCFKSKAYLRKAKEQYEIALSLQERESDKAAIRIELENVDNRLRSLKSVVSPAPVSFASFAKPKEESKEEKKEEKREEKRETQLPGELLIYSPLIDSTPASSSSSSSVRALEVLEFVPIPEVSLESLSHSVSFEPELPSAVDQSAAAALDPVYIASSASSSSVATSSFFSSSRSPAYSLSSSPIPVITPTPAPISESKIAAPAVLTLGVAEDIASFLEELAARGNIKATYHLALLEIARGGCEKGIFYFEKLFKIAECQGPEFILNEGVKISQELSMLLFSAPSDQLGKVAELKKLFDTAYIFTIKGMSQRPAEREAPPPYVPPSTDSVLAPVSFLSSRKA